MSFRICVACDHVINNRFHDDDNCPECGSLKMVDPLQDNRDWDELYKIQKRNMYMSTFDKLVDECRKLMLETNIVPAHNVILRNLDELSKDQLKAIIVNYTGFTNFSIHCLLDAAVRLHEWKYMQQAALNNIAEELGKETDNIPHLEIMRYGFKKELGIDTEGQTYFDDTHNFFHNLKKLLNSKNKALLTGALCAFEGIAVPEFHILCPIVEKFIDRELDPEWESYRYIEGHKTFEIGHEADLIKNAGLYILPEHYADFKLGYHAMVIAFNAWWGDLYLEAIENV